MKKRITFIAIITLLTTLNIFGLNYPPKVSDVRFTQRTDDSYMVDIYYDVHDYLGDTMTVSIFASNDGGATFNFLISSVTGDIGDNILSGDNKHIVWDFGSDHPDYFSDQIIIKIIAEDHIVLGGPCPGIPTITYEGKTYNTVQIDDKCWLKENLNVGNMIVSDSATHNQTDNGILEKYCYNNDESYCDKYGGLYQWDEAMRYSTTEGAQGICPDGWHIPTSDEFAELRLSVSGLTNLVLAEGQDNNDDEKTNLSGFSGLYSGYRAGTDGSLFGEAKFTLYYSSTEAGYQLKDAGTQILRYDRIGIDYLNYRKNHGYSIRCLKD